VLDWPTILREHGPAVWRTVYRLLNHHSDAQDCYQETFVAAWQFAAHESIDDWRALLVGLGVRKALDRLRKRYREHERGRAIDAVREPASDTPSPPQQAAAADLLERVRHYLADMPDQHAQVFWLCCVEGFSHEQVSRRLGITAGAARVVLHRARTHLRAMLNPGDPNMRGTHEREPADRT
jgi:RNA polymerase sigma-70 factor, ECF subfamily